MSHERGQVAAEAAEVYERHFVPALFAQWPQHVLAAAGVSPDDRVLDVACGTGVLAREAARLVGPRGSVVGVDINEGMLAVARSRSEAASWVIGAAETLPFLDNSFDRAVSQFGLMFFEDQAKGVAEMLRVVRPGGSIAVAVWAPLALLPGYAVAADLLRELFGAEAAQSIITPFAFGEEAYLQALFEEAGAGSARIDTVVGKARFPSVADWIFINVQGWTLADQIDEQGFARLQQEAPKRLGRFTQPDGSVAFDAPARIVTAKV